MTDSTWHGDGPGDSIRASDADRERTADALRKHHAAGRLDDDEFQDRLDRCLAAKTLAELSDLVRDLPGERVSGRSAAWRARRFGPPFPFIALCLIAALLFSGAGHHWHHGAHHHHWFPWPLVVLLSGALFIAARRRWSS
jgi:hypothetical protein